MSGWFHISSAPKDGTGLMLYALEWKCHAYAIGSFRRFSDGSSGWVAQVFHTVPAFADGSSWWGSLSEPTHWQFLPEPPA